MKSNMFVITEKYDDDTTQDYTMKINGDVSEDSIKLEICKRFLRKSEKKIIGISYEYYVKVVVDSTVDEEGEILCKSTLDDYVKLSKSKRCNFFKEIFNSDLCGKENESSPQISYNPQVTEPPPVQSVPNQSVAVAPPPQPQSDLNERAIMQGKPADEWRPGQLYQPNEVELAHRVIGVYMFKDPIKMRYDPSCPDPMFMPRGFQQHDILDIHGYKMVDVNIGIDGKSFTTSSGNVQVILDPVTDESQKYNIFYMVKGYDGRDYEIVEFDLCRVPVSSNVGLSRPLKKDPMLG